MTVLDRIVPASWRARIRGMLSPRLQVRWRCWLKGYPVPRWGNMRRLAPFSTDYGFERGTPIDRYYLEQFLAEHRADISGTVLEVQGPGYTRRFGHGVTLSESVDISPDVGATYTCDLAEADRVIPPARFDCFLLPNTLYALRDLEQALKQSLRLVRPGGTILASTASAFVPLDTGSIDYWRLTPAGWREVTRRAWPDCDIEIRQYGNPVAALAALHGIAAEELTAAELHANDPRYPVQIAIRCRKR